VVDRRDDYIRPRGYYDNKGNLLNVGFDVINGWSTGKTDKTEFDEHTTSTVHIGLNPACRVYHNAAQSIPNGVGTALAFNSERFDTDTMHDLVTNNSRITCKTAGIYLMSASIEYAESAVGIRAVYFILNGGTAIGHITQNASSNMRQSASTIYSLSVNNYLECFVYQNSGGVLDINSSGNYSPEFSVVRIA